MRNWNVLKMRVSEIRVKRIRVNQGLGVFILLLQFVANMPNAIFG